MAKATRPARGARRPARRPIPRGSVVCLISANPLALPELRRLARGPGLRFKPYHLKLGLTGDVHDVRVPRASVFVLDTFSTGIMTEAIVAAIRTRHPRARLIALVDEPSEVQGFALMHLGVKGIMKQRDVSGSLGRAISFIAAGGVRMPRGLMAKFLDSALGAEAGTLLTTARRLSQRERQVLDGVVKSQSNKEIANDLHISESTVKFHLARLFEKFGVRRRAELIVQSVQEPAMLVH